MQTSHLPASAGDIGQRVLKLIDSIHGTGDIAPEHIQNITGIPVQFNPDDANEYGFGGKLDDTWAYNLVSLTEANGAKPNRLMFSFDDQTRDYADMAPISDLDFDDYAKALTAAGFQSKPMRGKHDRLVYWDFSRNDVTVQVYVRGENDAKAEHHCVTKLIINA